MWNGGWHKKGRDKELRGRAGSVTLDDFQNSRYWLLVHGVLHYGIIEHKVQKRGKVREGGGGLDVVAYTGSQGV